MQCETTEEYERRAPGWRIYCMKCGYVEPYGKYGIRIGAVSWKKCTLGYCKRCKWIRCHGIAKEKNLPKKCSQQAEEKMGSDPINSE